MNSARLRAWKWLIGIPIAVSTAIDVFAAAHVCTAIDWRPVRRIVELILWRGRAPHFILLAGGYTAAVAVLSRLFSDFRSKTRTALVVLAFVPLLFGLMGTAVGLRTGYGDWQMVLANADDAAKLSAGMETVRAQVRVAMDTTVLGACVFCVNLLLIAGLVGLRRRGIQPESPA